MSDYISSRLLTTSINVEIKNIKGDINQILYKLLKKNMKECVIKMDMFKITVYKL